MAENKKLQTFRLRPELVRALDFFCQKKNRSKTDTVEKALTKNFDHRKENVTGLQEILDDED